MCVEGEISHANGLRIPEEMQKALARYSSRRVLIDLRKARNTSTTMENFGFALAVKRKEPELSEPHKPLRIAFLTALEDESHDRVLSILSATLPASGNSLVSKDEGSALSWLLSGPGFDADL